MAQLLVLPLCLFEAADASQQDAHQIVAADGGIARDTAIYAALVRHAATRVTAMRLNSRVAPSRPRQKVSGRYPRTRLGMFLIQMASEWTCSAERSQKFCATTLSTANQGRSRWP